MVSVFDKDKVFRTVIDEMVKRWQAPKGVDEDTVMGDYVIDLAEFSEDQLRLAFEEVRREWEYKTWPPVGAFRKKCQYGGAAVPQSKESDRETFLAQCRRKADKIASDLTKSQKYIDAGYWKDGLFITANPEIRDRSYRSLVDGGDGDPKVTQSDMKRWRDQAESRRKDTPGNLGEHLPGAA